MLKRTFRRGFWEREQLFSVWPTQPLVAVLICQSEEWEQRGRAGEEKWFRVEGILSSHDSGGLD